MAHLFAEGTSAWNTVALFTMVFAISGVSYMIRAIYVKMQEREARAAKTGVPPELGDLFLTGGIVFAVLMGVIVGAMVVYRNTQ